MSENVDIPQAALSAPETRANAEPVLCIVCHTEVSMIDRNGDRSTHPLCEPQAKLRRMVGAPGSKGARRLTR